MINGRPDDYGGRIDSCTTRDKFNKLIEDYVHAYTVHTWKEKYGTTRRIERIKNALSEIDYDYREDLKSLVEDGQLDEEFDKLDAKANSKIDELFHRPGSLTKAAQH